ncbi:xaa-Pro aminopeptidase family enzyme [Apiospora rasikravindrae]|uniref:Xaa-Pro aminopeptidase family enzyme n=1 Tax=Apiospora rasikravindrae TaxID=990691 RepID=A0ABR1S057_9PEZI
MRGSVLIATGIALVVQSVIAGTNPHKTPQSQTLPSLRDQAQIVDGWTDERKALIPGILRKYGVGAWLISQREYAEDTVFWALKEATMFSARRRTTQLFLANATAEGSYSYTWVDNTDLVWKELKAILDTHQPSKLALNTAAELAFASGLHAGERDAIADALGSEWADRFVLEPMLAVEVVATMVPSRLPWYRKMMETAWAIIEQGFSDAALNYTTWFQPSVYILGKTDLPAAATTTRKSRGRAMVDDPRAPDHSISYGDILHTDFGVTAMGLNTDTQHLAHVLYPGQTAADVPASVVEGLKKANRLQDIVVANMEIGRTGDEILKRSLDQAHAEGIEGKIYCHATGEWGHSAGTVIGMTNLQDGVPVLGELPLLKNTYYSIELYAEHFVPERNMTIKFPQEEDVFWNDETGAWEWVYGQQTELILVHTKEKEKEVLRVQDGVEL